MAESIGCNQGSAMLVVTFVYAVATIFICLSNRKSANAASEQITALKDSQLQNVNIQLFEKRHEVYSILNQWHHVAKLAFSKTIPNPSTGKDILVPQRAFIWIMLQETELKTENINYENVEEYLASLKIKRLQLVKIDPVDAKHAKDLDEFNTLLDNRIRKISDIVNRVKHERYRLDLTKYVSQIPAPNYTYVGGLSAKAS